MTTKYIPIKRLYSIFTDTDIIEYEVKKNIDIKRVFEMPNKYLMSPTAKSIYNSLAPDEKRRMRYDYKYDNDKLLQREEKDYMDDPDFNEKLENNAIGLYMEAYVSVFGKCPGCGQNTLRCYDDMSTPVVDVICINRTPQGVESHKIYPRIYQIKVSLNNSTYFTKDYIHVGSQRYGYNSHMAHVRDIKYNNIVVGYICIHLDDGKEEGEYNINTSKSYVLLPRLNKRGVNGTYYTYKTGTFFGKLSIIRNKDAVDEHPINKCLDNNKHHITTSIIFHKNSSPNPMGVKTERKNLSMELRPRKPLGVVPKDNNKRDAGQLVASSEYDKKIDTIRKDKRRKFRGGNYYSYIYNKLDYAFMMAFIN
jgi:hypothetical protein